jgi:hypothetical protein
MTTPKPAVEQPSEQARYATVLDWGTRVGLVLLVASFAAYVLGLMPTQVAPERLPQLWSMPVDQFLAETGSPTGWAWTHLLGKADMLALSGIAFLSGISILCLLVLVPLFSARKDRAFVAICLAEVLVLLLAASGWLAGGH